MKKNTFILLSSALILSCSNSTSVNKSTIRKPAQKPDNVKETPIIDTQINNADKVNEIYYDFVSTLPLTEHVWKGYEILDTVKGDLNQDGRDDYIMILKKPNEKETSDVVENPTPRPLLILTQQPNGKYKMEAVNEKTVLCVDCGGAMGDPYTGITIKGKYFSIEHHGGSRYQWLRIITYKYDNENQNWFLHKDGHENMDMHNLEEDPKSTILTPKDFGIVAFNEFDIYKEEK